MKKIIYSLVIMIAAGSLFTSCVENTEPQGIKVLREAKADYLAALSNLRAADAEKVKAEAAVEQAKAAIKQAEALKEQALAKAEELKNEAQKVQDEVAAEKAKAAIDSIKAAAEQAAVKAEQDLAQAQWDLEVALRKIAAESFTLTAAEDSIIKRTADSLLVAQNAYNKEVKKLNKLNQRLWEAEYDHAAGCDSITEEVYPSKNYQDSVAAYQKKIAEKTADIAKLEEVKEKPAAAKDIVDAYKATVKELQEDSLAAVTSKSLYDATKLVEASKAYKEKVDAFKTDSVGTKPAYCFTKDKDKKVVKYPLTNGKGLDARFGLYLNTIKYGNKTAGKTAAQYGIKVNDKNIEVGGITINNDKYLDSALVIVDEIVEALNRDLVVVNDSTEAKDYEDLVKTAKLADSTYKAHRAILEKGLKAYEPYKLANDTVKMFEDTVNTAKTAKEEADGKLAGDTTTVKTAIKTAAAAYIKANKDFVTALNNVKSHRGSLHGADSSQFVDATIALGEAQAAYFGKEDSLPMKKLNLQTGRFDDVNLPFSGLVAAGFVVKDTTGGSPIVGKVTSLYGGEGYGEYANIPAYQDSAYYTPEVDDPFSRVARIALNDASYAWTVAKEEKDVEIFHSIYYNSDRAIAYTLEHLGATARKDTVGWLKSFVDVTKATAVAPAYATHKADSTAAKVAADALATAEGKLNGKKNAVNTAIAKYQAIYNSFNGNKTTTGIPTDDSVTVFKWSDKTFSEPENCIEFGIIPSFAGIIDTRGIIENNELVIALDGVDGPGYVAGSKYINSCKIFKGDSCATEFAKAIYAAQLRDEKANYKFLEDQLANINEQVAAIKTDVKAYNETYAEASKGYKEGLKALTGKDVESAIVYNLSAAVVDSAKGVWKLKGKQLEFANEVAPEYPELVKATVSGNAAIAKRIGEINVICDTLNSVITQWAKFEDPTNMGSVTTIQNVIDKLDNLIGGLEDEITAAKKDIVVFEKAIAMAEQGYDAYTIAVTALKQQIANAEEAVARAEAILKIRKAEYEAVIAQYGVNE